jgi:hypothetical protein
MVLTLHIIGAVFSIAYIAIGLIQLVVGKGSAQASRMAAMGLILYQLATGILLLVTLPGISISALCIKGLAMIGSLVVVNYAVARRLATH